MSANSARPRPRPHRSGPASSPLLATSRELIRRASRARIHIRIRIRIRIRSAAISEARVL
ncbi:hypothetical protein [Microbacterium arborescens]|uniref:hypothetical protein n=1 Tax=Microbacterium arborescens TaxID=33883 RepID=UPI003C716FC4